MKCLIQKLWTLLIWRLSGSQYANVRNNLTECNKRKTAKNYTMTICITNYAQRNTTPLQMAHNVVKEFLLSQLVGLGLPATHTQFMHSAHLSIRLYTPRCLNNFGKN